MTAAFKPSSLADRRVLLAVDSRALATTLIASLRSLGVGAIRKTHDSAQTLRLLASEPFDVLVIDAGLGPQDGIAITRAVRMRGNAVNRAVAIIMVSGPSDRKHIEAARDAGITEFVRLPASTRIIGMRLRSALDVPRPFVTADAYAGPDRRRRAIQVDIGERRR